MLRLCSHIHISYGRFRVFSCKHSKKYIHSSIPIISQKITSLSINQTEYAKTLADSLIQGNRYSLARAITLLESSKAERRAEGQYILDAVIKHLAHQELKTGKFTFRIGKLIFLYYSIIHCLKKHPVYSFIYQHIKSFKSMKGVV